MLFSSTLLLPFLLSSSMAAPALLRRQEAVNLTTSSNTTTLNSTDINNSTTYLGPIDTNSTVPISIPFASCPVAPGGLPAEGVVNSVKIFPCERAGDDEPCRFRYGMNYTILVNYTSFVAADAPKHTLLARDDTTVPSTKYPYSGQSFDACQYISCPVKANVTSQYVYNFNTLLSPFNFLSVNVTQKLEGPSLFCAGFYAQYLAPGTDSVGDSAPCEPSFVATDGGDEQTSTVSRSASSTIAATASTSTLSVIASPTASASASASASVTTSVKPTGTSLPSSTLSSSPSASTTTLASSTTTLAASSRSTSTTISSSNSSSTMIASNSSSTMIASNSSVATSSSSSSTTFLTAVPTAVSDSVKGKWRLS